MPRLGQVDKVAEALQALGDHLDSRYWQSFEQAFPADWLHYDDIEDLKNKFFITSKNLYCNAQAEAEAVHEEKINWGRIITHFCFTSQLACAAVLSKQYQLVAELTNWLTQFITGHLRVWIEQNGGWVRNLLKTCARLAWYWAILRLPICKRECCSCRKIWSVIGAHFCPNRSGRITTSSSRMASSR